MASITEFSAAVNQICAERGINPEDVYEALEAAILAAYKREHEGEESLKVEIDRESGEIQLIAEKVVVSEVTDTATQISLADAQKMEPNLRIDDHIEIEIPIEEFGRIATQAAKQVILQKMRESEKDAVLAEFKDKLGTVATGLVQRMIGPTAEVEIGKAVAHMPPEEQIPNEFYKIGERYKFLIKEIRDEQDLIVSRSSPEFLIELFRLEVPELESGIIEVKAVAREAGSRSKVAVISHQEGVDPIGSCVGQKGMRIANVMSELGDEKIDIIEWSPDQLTFIANALGPARVEKVEVPEEGVALVHVVDDQLSLAIGRDGQNVRLAAKLTEMKVDITAPGLDESRRHGGKKAEPAPELSARVLAALEKAGVSVQELTSMKEEDIKQIKGIGKVALEEIMTFIAAQSAVPSVGQDKSEETTEEKASEDKGGAKETSESASVEKPAKKTEAGAPAEPEVKESAEEPTEEVAEGSSTEPENPDGPVDEEDRTGGKNSPENPDTAETK